jgi:hypothetical protein
MDRPPSIRQSYQRFRKPNPLRRGNVASRAIGIVRKPTRCWRDAGAKLS